MNEEVSGYIRAFLYGLKITSQLTSVIVQPDYINQILKLVMGEDGAIKFSYLDSQEYKYDKDGNVQHASSLTIYADRSAYNFITSKYAFASEINESNARFIATYNQEEGQYLIAPVDYIITIAEFEAEFGTAYTVDPTTCEISGTEIDRRFENAPIRCNSVGDPQVDGTFRNRFISCNLFQHTLL